MIAAMPRPRWPHLLREVSRHGTVRWVVRLGHGPRIALKSAFGTPEFEAEYHAAVRGDQPATGARKAAKESLAWLWDRYRASSAWGQLKPATRRQRENIMRHVLAGAGDAPFAAIDRKTVIEGRERRAKTPSQANNFLNTLRSLFAWAVENEHLEANPCEGVKIVKRPKTGGFKEGTEEEIAKFEARWPLGTRERLALAIFLETGLRRGDAAQLGRQHLRDGMIAIRTEKAGQPVRIPVSDALAAAIAATPSRGLTFIAQADGQPLTKESLGNWFREAAEAAKVSFSAHGLRKAAAARLVDLGLTEAELEQIMGWAPGSGMARIYSKRRDSAKLADRAAAKLKAEPRTPYSQPPAKVGKEAEKGK
jgi:integrase